jgi:hypothetical protein
MKISLVVLAALLGLAPRPAAAHCDGLDGPVVKAARAAVDRGDVRLALAWVQPADEAGVRAAFEQANAVRKLGGAAKDLAERYFFETLVRLHRAGEGAPYTGLKPAGRDLGPAIPAADRALTDGSVDALVEELKHTVEHGVRERFAAARAASKHDAANVDAGRAFVKAYVEFLHYVERAHEAAAPAKGHAH